MLIHEDNKIEQTSKQNTDKRTLSKTNIIIIVISAILLLISSIVAVFVLSTSNNSQKEKIEFENSPENKYLIAEEKMNAGKYLEAAEIFEELGDYSNSQELRFYCNRMYVHKYIVDNKTTTIDGMPAILLSELPEQIHLCAGKDGEIIIKSYFTGGSLNNPMDTIENNLKLTIPPRGNEGSFSVNFVSHVYVYVVFSYNDLGGERIGTGNFDISKFNRDTELIMDKVQSNDSMAVDLNEIPNITSVLKEFFGDKNISVDLADLGFISIT